VVVTTPTPRAREQRESRRYARYAICSATLLLLVVAERWLLSRYTFPGDNWAASLGSRMIDSHNPRFIWALTRVYQQIGRPLVAIGEVLVMLIWLWRVAGRRTAQGLSIALLASAACGVIKIICGPTPMWISLYHVGTNFPSGVVTFMTASMGYVALVAWRDGRRMLPVMLVIAIIGSGPARVLGGQHLLSDVLGGYMLGLAWLLLAYMYLLGPDRSAEGKTPWNIASLEAPA
jgi:undecaprenyl-diphosphatase